MDSERYTAREQAAQWLARLDRGLRQDEGSKLRHWLQQSVHRTAILEVARQRAAPDVMALLTELFPISLQSVPQPPPRGSLGIVAAVGAAVCVLILGIWTFNSQRFSQFAPVGSAFHDSHGAVHPPMTRGAFATDVGQQREIKLPDGSTMMLNTASNVTVTYSLREREIFLSRGEASFNVAHDADRPFLVRAGHHHRLQAVGTRFDVRVLTPDTVELIVTEGQVTVLYTPREGPDTPAFLRLSGNRTSEDTTIDALEMAQVEPGLQFVRKVKPPDIEDALAWQRGRIVFKGERLEDALAEVDRYTNKRFVLGDDRLRDLRVAGDFSTVHIDDFIASLRRNYRIAAERGPGGRVVLRPLAAAGSQLPQPHGST